MRTSESNPQDWFLLAADRLRVADLAYQHEGVTYSGVELLQEAVERYLKGYLVARGWRLERTHDLARLIAAAATYDVRFANHASLAENLTDLFWDQHYPGADLTDFGCDYEALRSQADELLAVIQIALPQFFPPPAASSSSSV